MHIYPYYADCKLQNFERCKLEVVEVIEMRTMILGITWQVIGFFGAIALICIAALQNWDYNGITGLLGALFGMELLIPLIVCVLFFIVGIVLCFWNINKNNDR